jgi:hypothetical protein
VFTASKVQRWQIPKKREERRTVHKIFESCFVDGNWKGLKHVVIAASFLLDCEIFNMEIGFQCNLGTTNGAQCCCVSHQCCRCLTTEQDCKCLQIKEDTFPRSIAFQFLVKFKFVRFLVFA